MDAVLLYDCKEGAAAVAKAVRQVQEQGLSVRAEKQEPENIRYRELYRLKNGELQREEASC